MCPPTLLTLPPELRLQIYTHLWTGPKIEKATFHSAIGRKFKSYKVWPDAIPNPHHRFALLQTCRTIYSEAYKKTFKEQTVVLDGRYGGVRVPDQTVLGEGSALRFVRSVAVVCTDVEPFYARDTAPKSEIVIKECRELDTGHWHSRIIHTPPDPPKYEYERWERWQSVCRLVRVLPGLESVKLLVRRPTNEMMKPGWMMWCQRRDGRDGGENGTSGYYLNIGKCRNRIRKWKLWVRFDERENPTYWEEEEMKLVMVYVVAVTYAG